MAGQGSDLDLDDDEEGGDAPYNPMDAGSYNAGSLNANGKRHRDSTSAAAADSQGKSGMLRFAKPRYPMFENRDVFPSGGGDYGVGIEDLPIPGKSANTESNLSVLPLRYCCHYICSYGIIENCKLECYMFPL